MTAIAWDGTTLAGDKRGHTTYGTVYTVTKVYRMMVKGDLILVGFVGAGDRVTSMVRWIADGRDPEKYPPNPTDDTCFMLLIEHDGTIRRYEDTPWPQTIEEPFYAMGSGEDLCRAAMYLGCDAHRAVEIACHFNSACGNGIDALRFETPE